MKREISGREISLLLLIVVGECDKYIIFVKYMVL